MLALSSCVQSPDWIASTTLALDGGGIGDAGMGGTGGASGVGGVGGSGAGGTGGGGMGGAASASGVGGVVGGGGGMGGMPNDAGAIDCSRRMRTAYLLFSPLAIDKDRDGDNNTDLCTYGAYSSSDAELRVLLAEIIYSMDPPEPPFEEVAPDRLCNALNLPWHNWYDDSGFDPDKAVMCPRFCGALIKWVEERHPIEVACSASGAP
jgi:hypothetical protein